MIKRLFEWVQISFRKISFLVEFDLSVQQNLFMVNVCKPSKFGPILDFLIKTNNLFYLLIYASNIELIRINDRFMLLETLVHVPRTCTIKRRFDENLHCTCTWGCTVKAK